MICKLVEYIYQKNAGLIWLIGGFGIINGVLTIGTVTALINYQGMLISPMAFFSER